MPLLVPSLRTVALPRPSNLRIHIHAAVPRRPRVQSCRFKQQHRSQSTSTTTTKQTPKTENTTKPAEKRTENAVVVPGVFKFLWQRLGPLRRGIEAYGRSQRKRPYVTQTVSMLVIFALGDISAQQMGGREYDPVRTARSMVIGGVFAIPQFKWFVFLSKNFNYSSRALSLATKVAVNQAVFTPVFNVYFFGMQALLTGETLAATLDRIRRTVPRAIVNALKLWPATMVITFTYIPLDYRSLFSGTVAIGWQTYLSYLNRQAEIRQHQPEAVVDTQASALEAATAAAVAKV